ncbi:hypothetical protein CALCODRAFT_507043 [Calocera cornea HHB12733]|uniref:Uncharacterized protein n=1 Tax=Calocera cornea HHB12733 TaxID=1353952 RepID=A0A165I721_9BASI|nr:hypothetical protein CALCODRAFT_507043 [Calocera cornea HHB12733]
MSALFLTWQLPTLADAGVQDGELSGVDESDIHGLGASQLSEANDLVPSQLAIPDYELIADLMNAAQSAYRRHQQVDPSASPLFDPDHITDTMRALHELARNTDSFSFRDIVSTDPDRATFAYVAHTTANSSATNIINALDRQNHDLRIQLRTARLSITQLTSDNAALQQQITDASAQHDVDQDQVRDLGEQLSESRRLVATLLADAQQNEVRLREMQEAAVRTAGTVNELLAVTQERDAAQALIRDIQALINRCN